MEKTSVISEQVTGCDGHKPPPRKRNSEIIYNYYQRCIFGGIMRKHFAKTVKSFHREHSFMYLCCMFGKLIMKISIRCIWGTKYTIYIYMKTNICLVTKTHLNKTIQAAVKSFSV